MRLAGENVGGAVWWVWENKRRLWAWIAGGDDLRFKRRNMDFIVRLRMNYLTHPPFGWFPVFAGVDNATIHRACGFVGRIPEGETPNHQSAGSESVNAF